MKGTDDIEKRDRDGCVSEYVSLVMGIPWLHAVIAIAITPQFFLQKVQTGEIIRHQTSGSLGPMLFYWRCSPERRGYKDV